jgi:hypothetical protein
MYSNELAAVLATLLPASARFRRSALFSPIIMQVMHGLTLIMVGNMDALATL